MILTARGRGLNRTISGPICALHPPPTHERLPTDVRLVSNRLRYSRAV
jgi:hypothetical protein